MKLIRCTPRHLHCQLQLGDPVHYRKRFFRAGSVLICAVTLASGAVRNSYGYRTDSAHSPVTNPIQNHSDKDQGTNAEAELAKLVKAADHARTAGNPTLVAQSNTKLIAFALRMMGQLRLLESAYPQAVELYTRSLQYEDLPGTRIDLSIAELDADRPEDATEQAEKALVSAPGDLRASDVLGLAYLQNGNYAKATQVLSEVVKQQPGNMQARSSLALALLETGTASSKQQAEAVFQQMKNLAGDSSQLHLLFGQTYHEAGDLSDAAREFQRAIELGPSTPHVHYFLGLALLSMHDWKSSPEVISQFKEELRYHPHDFAANYMLGFLASSDRQYVVADKYLEASVASNPNWPESWLYLGLDAYAQGDKKRAEEMLRKAIATTGSDESRSNYDIRRAYISMGRILVSSGRQKEADKYLAKARELQNKVMQANQQSMAAMAQSRGKGAMAGMVPLDKPNPSGASTLQSGAVDATDPLANVDASVAAHANLTAAQLTAAKAQENSLRIVLGQSLSDLATSEAIQGEYQAALGHYKEASQWDDSIPELSKNLGQCAFRVKDYPLAASSLFQYVEHDPSSSPAIRAMLGMANYSMEKYGAAAHAFSTLGLQGMQDPTVGYLWADSLTNMQDLKKASEVLAEYQKSNLSNQNLLLVGQLWIQIGDYSRAVAVFQRALQTDPDLPQAHYYAGEAYSHWERWSDAATEFQAELKHNPANINAMYDLGYADLRQSKVPDAEKLFWQVLAIQPEYANAQYEIGKILMQQGKLEEAVPHLEAAARLLPDQDYVHYQLQAAYRKEGRTVDANRELKIYSAIKAKSHTPLAMSQTSNH